MWWAGSNPIHFKAVCRSSGHVVDRPSAMYRQISPLGRGYISGAACRPAHRQPHEVWASGCLSERLGAWDRGSEAQNGKHGKSMLPGLEAKAVNNEGRQEDLTLGRIRTKDTLDSTKLHHKPQSQHRSVALLPQDDNVGGWKERTRWEREHVPARGVQPSLCPIPLASRCRNSCL